MIRRLDACHSCTSCDYFIKYDKPCKYHIESKHPSTSGFTCQFCGKPRPTRNAPKLHTTKIIKKQLDRPYFSDSEPSLNPRWRSDLMVCGTAHFVENPLNWRPICSNTQKQNMLNFQDIVVTFVRKPVQPRTPWLPTSPDLTETIEMRCISTHYFMFLLTDF